MLKIDSYLFLGGKALMLWSENSQLCSLPCFSLNRSGPVKLVWSASGLQPGFPYLITDTDLPVCGPLHMHGWGTTSHLSSAHLESELNINFYNFRSLHLTFWLDRWPTCQDIGSGVQLGIVCDVNTIHIPNVWQIKVIDIFYMDISKAFDKVQYGRLIWKFWWPGIQGELAN